MKVLAITSWKTACGIADYAEQVIRHATANDVEFIPCPEGLDPACIPKEGWDVLWLNFHRGLHSRWTPALCPPGKPVVVTWHDSYGERAPDELTEQWYQGSDAFIVHEPCEGLEKQILIRQGVGGWSEGVLYDPHIFQRRPILGAFGFNFAWKNMDRIAEVSAQCGWGLFIHSNNATDEDVARWKASNPHSVIQAGFTSHAAIIAYLSGCDATIFAYECGNSGTSGAIRLGLAARKPVIAWRGCRQFRDLEADSVMDIRWCLSFASLPILLKYVPIQRVDPGIVAIAERDSWTNQGKKYTDVFRRVYGRTL